MTLVQISRKTAPNHGFTLLIMGFRVFFLAASLYSVASIGAWALVYSGLLSTDFGTLTPSQWHAHEMIYGYTFAVIAGFLLTAVWNWTGNPTASGMTLLALVALWIAPRFLFLTAGSHLEVAFVCDTLFGLLLLVAIASPIVASRQWRQLGVLSKVLMLLFGNTLFYLDALGVVEGGMTVALHGGVLIITALILTIGGRTIPAFIEVGAGEELTITNPVWIQAASLALFVGYFAVLLTVGGGWIAASFAIALFIVTTVRLWLWHSRTIWTRPLVWSLYLAIVFIDLGFLLSALAAFGHVSPFLFLHAFAYGGIGLATWGMMARVTLGHTGRNVRTPPRGTFLAVAILTGGALVRIAGPLIFPQAYAVWILLSQVAWATAFAGFIALYGAMLVVGRSDEASRAL